MDSGIVLQRFVIDLEGKRASYLEHPKVSTKLITD